eukprot:maker-scaffold347_size200506-snap-gene-0.25 protein:Tk02319 transcript:maker-scaffold347_size200506-snap-gene-0.25-mRNA-1 annotation:"hypothetical protein BRAFLDRAFT_120570"
MKVPNSRSNTRTIRFLLPMWSSSGTVSTLWPGPQVFPSLLSTLKWTVRAASSPILKDLPVRGSRDGKVVGQELDGIPRLALFALEGVWAGADDFSAGACAPRGSTPHRLTAIGTGLGWTGTSASSELTTASSEFNERPDTVRGAAAGLSVCRKAARPRAAGTPPRPTGGGAERGAPGESLCESNGSCSTEDEMCLSAKNQGQIQKINTWWNGHKDIKKPAKCQDRLKDVPTTPNSKDIILKLVPCNEGIKADQYVFKGKGTAGNGTINGPGKLKFGQFKVDEAIVDPSMCFEFKQINGNSILEVIGTFNNGTIHGPAKVVLTNGWTLIGRFHRGILHGFARLFSPAGNLIAAGYYTDGKTTGSAWTQPGPSSLLIFHDWGRENRSRLSVLAVANETVAWEAHHFEFADLLTEVADVSIDTVQVESDCLLDGISWSRLEAKDIVFQYQRTNTSTNLEVSRAFSPSKYCNSTLEENQTIREKYFAWNLDLSIRRHHWAVIESKPETSPVDSELSIPIISQDVTITSEGRKNLNATWFGVESMSLHLSDGGFDSEDRLHGFNTVLVSEPENKRLPTFLGLNVSLIGVKTHFDHGKPFGLAYFETSDHRGMAGWIQNNTIHGTIFIAGEVPVLPISAPKAERTPYVKPGIGVYGRVLNGRPKGEFWIGMLGGGRLFGRVDPETGFTGDNLTFVFPDMETGFHGKFQDSKMISTQEVTIEDFGCDENGMVTISQMSKPDGPTFYYEPPTNESFGAGPEGVPDPFEVKWVELKNSTIPGSGEGVYLKQKPLGDHYLCFYDGFIYNEEQSTIYRGKCTYNTSKSDDYRRHCKKYALGITYTGATINIPPEYDQPTSFHPTTAHKINHHFLRNNTYFGDMEHPRWGIIQSVRMSDYKTVVPNEEIFGFYGYHPWDFPEDFPWYHELKMQVERELRLQKQSVAKSGLVQDVTSS